jgi:hypothetical protein
VSGNRQPMKSLGLFLGAVLLALTGCQTDKPPVSNASFMTLWSAYDHCQSSEDLDTMRQDVKRLQEGIQMAQEQAASAKPDPVRPLLRPIERWIATPETRLSADPKAMAAACTLYTGQTAAQSGRTDLATELFTSVIQNYQQPPYAYYVNQARLGLAQINEPTQVSLTTIPTARPLP